MMYASIMVPLAGTMFVCGMLVGRNKGNDRPVGQILAAVSATLAIIGTMAIEAMKP